ncbi:hypothetical protein [Brevibacterium sp. UCMA 11754]|uniref:hypothetical protein n=1 Tax=Brevibacterium sp. UCMA 11754 TaxID=2749198 RepID=UPI002E1CFEE4
MGDFIADLTHSIAGTVDTSARRRAEYAVDASNYRVPRGPSSSRRRRPMCAAILDVARSHSVPITSRVEARLRQAMPSEPESSSTSPGTSIGSSTSTPSPRPHVLSPVFS